MSKCEVSSIEKIRKGVHAVQKLAADLDTEDFTELKEDLEELSTIATDLALFVQRYLSRLKQTPPSHNC
jgi:hypothetical protein